MRVTARKVAATICLAAPVVVLPGRGVAAPDVVTAPETVAGTHGVAGQGAVGAGSICTGEQYQWFGTQPLEPGQSWGTGVVVPALLGTSLQVLAFDQSTGAVVTTAVALEVGGSPIVAGAVVDGGEISATNSGSEPLTLTSVGVSVDRCAEVDSAASAQGLQGAARIVPVIAAPVVSPAFPTAPAAAPLPAVPETLPSTGATSLGLVYGAAACTAIGVVLMSLGRRRAIAFDREP